MSDTHPYQQWEGTPQWTALDRAVNELVSNRDLSETTAHEYVVGYLCRALDSAGSETQEQGVDRAQQSAVAIRKVQDLMRPYRRPGHSLVQELLDERRAEAARE